MLIRPQGENEFDSPALDPPFFLFCFNRGRDIRNVVVHSMYKELTQINRCMAFIVVVIVNAVQIHLRLRYLTFPNQERNIKYNN